MGVLLVGPGPSGHHVPVSGSAGAAAAFMGLARRRLPGRGCSPAAYHPNRHAGNVETAALAGDGLGALPRDVSGAHSRAWASSAPQQGQIIRAPHQPVNAWSLQIQNLTMPFGSNMSSGAGSTQGGLHATWD